MQHIPLSFYGHKGEQVMSAQSSAKRNITKIVLYILFSIVTFVAALLYMPYKFFFFAGIAVLLALKGLEKEVMEFRKQY